MAIFSMNTDGSDVTHLKDYPDEGQVTLKGLDMYEVRIRFKCALESQILGYL